MISGGFEFNVGYWLEVPVTQSIDFHFIFYLGHIVRIAKDQDGSRFIQQRLDYLADPAHNVASSSNEELNLVFSEAMSSIEDLWNDVYGNFILQKLLDHGTEDMKDELGDRFYADVVSLSNRVYG